MKIEVIVAVMVMLIVATAKPQKKCVPKTGSKVKIGSFNVKKLGESKFAKPDVMNVIYKIIGRYDILLMQELTDATCKVLPEMERQLNAQHTKNPFKYVASERLGRTDNKEQYVLWYRSNVTLLKTHQYNDTTDIFEREPFLTVVKVPQGSKVKTFGLINIHVKPDDAAEEIDALASVYDYYRIKLRLEDIMIGGDFNADCNYLSAKALSKTALRKDSRFVWLIPDKTDTTVAASSCAYDRLVAAGSKLIPGLDACSATPFRFDEEYGLDYNTTWSISDHYPVEVDLFAK